MSRPLIELEQADIRSLTDEELAIVKAAHNGKVHTAPPEHGTPRLEQGLVTRRMDEITPVSLRWLWPGVIPAGKLIIFFGDPGLGKSLATLDVISRVTRGVSSQDDSAPCPIGDVVLLSAEDDPADTIRPRLDAAGAIPSLVRFVDGVRDVKGKRMFSLAADVAKLETAITQETRIVVIDPITAYLDGVDGHSTGEVRGLLAPLAEMAARRGVAILAVAHGNKAGGPAIYRLSGSLAWMAAARSVWAFAKDRENPARVLMTPVKQNLAADQGGFAYTVVVPDGVPVMTWEKGRVHVSADEALQHDDPEERSAGREASEWLREALSGGPVKAADLFRQARAEGIATITLRRTASKLGVRKDKGGFREGWSWALPGPEDDHLSPEGDQDAHTQGNDHLDHLGRPGDHLGGSNGRGKGFDPYWETHDPDANSSEGLF